MNPLPVGPHQLADKLAFDQYFDDIKRWKFDVAYNAYYALPKEEVFGPLREVYTEFAAEARRRGYPSCVQLQITVCHPSVLPISEAQRREDNMPDVLPNGNFFASFASRKWRAFLKDLTTFFVQDCGFEWVVFGEPVFRADIPGTEDPFFELFRQRYPDVDYPTARQETTAYLKVQELKAEVLLDFLRELAQHAKTVGAARVGVIPWSFIPTVENAPCGTLNTSCDIGRVIALPEVDFVVVRMQPDNIFANAMSTGDDMQQSPLLYYAEVLAHSTGKPVVAVDNPTDEHADFPACPLIPADFSKKATLASLAAAPDGMMRHWHPSTYDKDSEQMTLMLETNKAVARLGGACSPIGFVFSHSGGRHAEPYTYETVWRFYWSFARRMLYEEHRPIMTFSADALRDVLKRNPELRLLVLDSHFPLTCKQTRLVKDWCQGKPGRGVVLFGDGLGFSSSVDKPGLHPDSEVYAELFETFGLTQGDVPQMQMPGERVKLRHTSRAKRATFLGTRHEVNVPALANTRRVAGSRTVALYTEEQTGVPAIWEWRDRDSMGIYCGLGLSSATAQVAAGVLRYAISRLHISWPLVAECSPDVLWSATRNGYLVIANCGDEPGSARIESGRKLLWDVVEQRLLDDEERSCRLGPAEFRVFRCVTKRSKLLDVIGAIDLRKVADGAGRADIVCLPRDTVSCVVKTPPKSVLVDGKTPEFSIRRGSPCYVVEVEGLPQEECCIRLSW